MPVTIGDEIAAARGLADEDRLVVRTLVEEWRSHVTKNRLRDTYYLGHAPVKDLGISVTPALMRKLRPHCDWAAKCVDWWADRVQFEGVSLSDDEADQGMVDGILAQNDMKTLVHDAANSALRHSCSFLTVTRGDEDAGEPRTVISGYPATAASAVWDQAARRISAGLVVVATDRRPGTRTHRPTLCYALTDTDVIVLQRGPTGWVASYEPHAMGRCPMVHVAYHRSLERPFGRSRITRQVRDLVDDAQREMANMAVAAAFAAAPQKFLLGADKKAAQKIADSPFAAFMGSVMTATPNSKGQIPQYGQLSQGSMQPHTDYMRMLAATFSGVTGVPLSSLGVVTDNPSSAEAIYAGKEDAVVDIQAFVDSMRRSLADLCRMAVACESDVPFSEASATLGTVLVNFANPAMPSIVSQSDAMVKQVSVIPWLADSDVTLRELGYDDEQIAQLRSDRARNEAHGSVSAAIQAAAAGAGAAGDEPKDGGEG